MIEASALWTEASPEHIASELNKAKQFMLGFIAGSDYNQQTFEQVLKALDAAIKLIDK